MYSISSKTDSIVNAMLSKVPARFKTDMTKSMFKDAALGYVQSLSKIAPQITASGTILGGACVTPGGPLVGGLLTCAPGTLVAPDIDVKSAWTLGVHTTVVDGKTITGNTNTEYMQALRDVIASQARVAWMLWTKLWMTSALAVAQGGVDAWISSVPPAPGPWTGGTIQPFVLAPTVGLGGTNASPALSTFVNTVVTTCKATPLSITMPEGNKWTSTIINNKGPDGEMFVTAIAYGWFWLINDFVTTVQVYDPTGASAVGIAAPVTGSITSGTIAGMKLMLG